VSLGVLDHEGDEGMDGKADERMMMMIVWDLNDGHYYWSELVRARFTRAR
jgi:hypothetical protein